MTQYTNKNIVVLGAGESGCGAAVLAHKKSNKVWVSDLSRIADKYKQVLSDHQIDFEEGKHTYDIINKADVVIKSPGIPESAEVIRHIRNLEIPILSEIEFAGPYSNAKYISITGTNGKTTTTLLTHHILKKAGLNVGLAGNVGHSLAMQIALNDCDYYVLELSSFQLDDMYSFKSDIAVLLNITPDHLDRYEYSLQKYIDSKFRILQNQTINDAFIYCADDPILQQEVLKRNPAATTYPFSIKMIEGMAAYLEDNKLNINHNKNLFTMFIYDLALQGKHNIYNSMAASVAAKILDIRNDDVRESLSDFQNAEHRLEFVNTIFGIDFINDSKATNINSTWYALESMTKPVIWIVGGQDKGNDYSMIKDLVKEKVKAIVCLGKDNSKILKAFRNVIDDISEARSAEEAVRMSYKKGTKGDVVLLSPACASFDLFKNYEDRGWQFKAAVKSL
ncbi:MAG TPA: UDP-N-acetylmuramoyl-L-alanine--D-glutamate ligase [Bacteroidia bacterium]|nr:UDP-N-acetylmuramoyl-L-alanine--D-glutamate ligase [Bacteroidia bacterium]HNT79887.1 UDP-N-acetylmuramoyl-L-alanine--D-glutamate ligase [Bacteroidia bacterium]